MNERAMAKYLISFPSAAMVIPEGEWHAVERDSHAVIAEAKAFGVFNAVGPDYTLTTDAMVYGCQAVTANGVQLTHVTPQFIDEQKVELPIWVPREGNPYSGYGTVGNARALAAGLTLRPLATTVADLLDWFHALPADRRAKPRAGISREKEAELLALWKARAAS